MENQNQKTKYEELGIPKNIIIQNYKYCFKKELTNTIVSYRWCKALLKISIENAKKIENKEGVLTSIDFTISGEHTNHQNENNIVLDDNKIKTVKETLELSKKLIKQNLQNPLFFIFKI